MNLERIFVTSAKVLNFWTQAGSKGHRSEINQVLCGWFHLKRQAQNIYFPLKAQL